MRLFCQRCFKGTNLLLRTLRTWSATYTLRVKLWINHVSYGHDVRAVNAVPAFVVALGNRDVTIGHHVKFASYNNTSWHCRCQITVGRGARLTIADHAGINGSLIYCMNRIEIGRHTQIGGGSRIYDTNFHNLDWQARRDPQLNGVAATAPVIIGDDVFVGTCCIIGKGVTIGPRSIIAAGSVVTRSIPADELWGGNPARFIKKLESNNN